MKQGDIAIGKPFQPVFDDWSNPCWGVDIERVRLEEVSRGDLPISPPEIVPSIWTGEPPPGLEEETIQDCHLTNALISAFFRGAAATTIEVDSATGQAYIKKGKIMFLIDLIDPYTNTYRVVAFTKEPAPDAEESK
ncbi:hypothetical protein ISS30_07900 [bacterium]|nr:hypothetical protein [FCB group bacterium]MBL7191606.1 hypothetical protein [bacterium]